MSAGLVGSPAARAGRPYRIVRRICRLVGWRLFRVHATGLEHLPRDAAGGPAGGWICAALPHRTWVEPLLLIGLLPAEPRLAMMADARTALGSWWRRLLVGLVGGVVPVTPRGRAGARGFESHLAAARLVLEAGMVFSVFPESGPPSRPPALRRVSAAVAYFSLRSGAPIVPVVFGGTDEPFLRRPITVRVLAPLAPPAPPPAPGSRAEREAAETLLAELLDRAVPAAAEVHAAAEPAAGTRRRWRWLRGPYPRA